MGIYGYKRVCINMYEYTCTKSEEEEEDNVEEEYSSIRGCDIWQYVMTYYNEL